MDIILAVDNDITVHEKQTAEWAKHGIGTLRVGTMAEAINRAKKSEKFLFIAINEDSVPNFWETLRFLRYVTEIPIYIITSSYSVAKNTKALQMEADAYGSFAENTKGDILAGVTLLKQQNKKRKTKPLTVLAGADIVLSTSCRTVIVNDVSVKLNRKEFDILKLLMTNIGRFVSPAKLLDKVWDKETADINALWQAIKRLRTKLAEVSPNEYIESERDFGYKFLA